MLTPNSALCHGDDPQRIPDVRQRIAVQDDEVGELALLERADLLLETECQRAFGRRHAQNLVVGDARMGQQRELEVDAEAIGNRGRIGAYGDPSSGPEQARNGSLQRR